MSELIGRTVEWVILDERRDPDAVTAYRFADGRLLELTEDEYREQAARRAAEWSKPRRGSDPGSVLGYKPDWAPEAK